MPLSAYKGEYWNPGYQGMVVETKGNNLYIDAKDRSFPVELTFHHVSGQTNYAIDVRYGEAVGGIVAIRVKGEFLFDNDRASKLGLQLDPMSEGLIWFDRVEGDYVVVASN